METAAASAGLEPGGSSVHGVALAALVEVRDTECRSELGGRAETSEESLDEPGGAW